MEKISKIKEILEALENGYIPTPEAAMMNIEEVILGRKPVAIVFEISEK